MFDARTKLESEKRIYKSVRGLELDVTYMPFGLTKLGMEYTTAYFDSVNALKEYQKKSADKITEKDVDDLQKRMKIYTDKGKEIIIAALHVNGKDVDEKWLEENLVADEFHLLINYIQRRDDADEKKTNSLDGNQTQ